VIFGCPAADVPKQKICTLPLDASTVATFKRAVQKHYWYELFIDDLPVWGFVGPPPEETKDDQNIYIYTHKSFDINYNDNRVRAPLLFCGMEEMG
jgi:transmembrane 9 superfamily member 3